MQLIEEQENIDLDFGNLESNRDQRRHPGWNDPHSAVDNQNGSGDIINSIFNNQSPNHYI